MKRLVSYVATMYREADDYEFGVEVKVNLGEAMNKRTNSWLLATSKAIIEANMLGAQLISLERLPDC